MILRGLMTGLLLLAGMTLITACGWHLRGSVEISEKLKTPYLIADAIEPALKSEIEVSFRDAGASIVAEESAASIVVEILGGDYQRKVIAVDSEGRALTYELGYKLRYRYRFPGAAWEVENQGQVVATANYQYDSNQVLSKASEEQNLIRQLKDSVSSRLLQQLSIRIKSHED